jgi:hypothetical protein
VGLLVGSTVGRGVGLTVGSTVESHAAGRPASPVWHSSPVHWYSLSYKHPLPEHGSSTPQRILLSFAHTFVASYQSLGAKGWFFRFPA